MKNLLRLLPVVAVLAACSTLALKDRPITTVILVRHAEKSAPSGDVPLSEAGHARARALAEILSRASIRAIYTTPFQRTQQTAAPLASVLSIEPVTIATGDHYPRHLINEIVTKHRGEAVLVVGHSNTTPDVLRELGIKDPPAIADSEYDGLFVCTLIEGVAPKLLVLRY